MNCNEWNNQLEETEKSIIRSYFLINRLKQYVKVDSLKNNIESLKEKINSTQNINANSYSAVLSEKELKKINEIHDITLSFEEYLESLIKMFNSSTYFMGKMEHRIIPKEKINEISIEFNDLLRKILSTNLELSNKYKKQLFNYAYGVIKKEYEILYYSDTILTLESYGKTEELIDIVMDDIKFNSKKEIVYLKHKDINKETIKDIIKLLILYEFNIRDLIIKEYKNNEEYYNTYYTQKEQLEETLSSEKKEIIDYKNKFFNSYKKSFKSLISLILSASVVLGAGYGMFKFTKGVRYPTTTKTKVEYEYYDTVNGKQTKSDYIALNKQDSNNKTLTIYFPTLEDGSREYKIYKILVDKNNIEDNIDLSLTEADLIESGIINNEEINNVSNDEYRVVSIPLTINKNDTIEVQKSEEVDLFGVLITLLGELLLLITFATIDQKTGLTITNMIYQIINIISSYIDRVEAIDLICILLRRKWITNKQIKLVIDKLKNILEENDKLNNKYREFNYLLKDDIKELKRLP